MLAWSADGRSLLVYREDGDRTPPPHLGELALYSLASGTERPVTDDDTLIEPIVFSATAATFSRDGSAVAFAGKGPPIRTSRRCSSPMSREGRPVS